MPTTASDTSVHEDEDDLMVEYERQDEAEDSANEESKEESGTGRRIDPTTSKKSVARNTVPTLKTEHLKGPNGIHTIEKYFEGFKFYGKGHEKEDLDRVMKRMEHWAYKLFPKLGFDDFLKKVEKLGTKKDLQVFVKKYQQDMIDTNDGLILENEVDDGEEEEAETEPIDEFDILIAEQIEKQKQVAIQQSAAANDQDAKFDQLLATSSNATSSQNITVPSQLSDEVKERIERNRQQAIQRRLARLQAMQEEAKRKKLQETEKTNLSREESVPSTSTEQEPNSTQNLNTLEGTNDDQKV